MNLIIETDIGHDPDDFFAITWLAACGVNIKGILIHPGDPDQIAIAKFICKELDLDIPVGASSLNKDKLSSGSIHHQLLKKYKYNLSEKADCLGKDIVKNNMDCEFFIIGPVVNIGTFIEESSQANFNRVTMQGGFCPYKFHRPQVTLDKFEGKNAVPTFNLGGSGKYADIFLKANSYNLGLVGKNICHTVEFTKDKFKLFDVSKAKNKRAAELFIEAGNMYFEKHDSKKFHDPTAACLHLNPNVGKWDIGVPLKTKEGWTTIRSVNSLDNDVCILVDINYDNLWSKLSNFCGDNLVDATR